METLTLPSLDEIRQAREGGLVSVRGGTTIICNYTPKAQFNRVWTPTTMTCRGLILRVDKPWPHSTKIEEVVALPWSKFYNVGEEGRLPSTPVVDVTEKADGSLGILHRSNGEYKIATRGSFASNQALWATERLKRHKIVLPENLTLLFEIIYPENRVVIDYGQREDLVLLGVRDRFTGEDWSWSDIHALGMRCHFSVIPRVHLTLNEATLRATSLSGDHEGWVLRCEDGTRWKVKGLVYRALHHFLTHLSERKMINAMLDGTYEELFDGTPSYYQKQLTIWHDRAVRELEVSQMAIRAIFDQAPDGMRKDFALWAIKQNDEFRRMGASPISSYLFALYDQKDITPMLLKSLRERTSPDPVVNPIE